MAKRTLFVAGGFAFALILASVLWVWFENARKPISVTNECANNLRLIEAAKEQWKLEYNKAPNATPNWNDLRPYLPVGMTNGKPACPQGGTYRIGRVDELPTCSIGGAGHSVYNR